MIRNDLTNEQYHAENGISKSDLDLIHKSPAHYKAKEPLDSKALFIGTAVHAAVLEPERFETDYFVLPDDFNGRTKDGKELMKKIEESCKLVLKADEAALALRIRESVHAQSIAAKILNGAQFELSGFAEMDGVMCKCRPDIWNPELGIIADLKTTTDASPKGFLKSISNYRYFVQAAFYKDVWARAADVDVRAFIFIAVEKTAPYSAALYTVDDSFMEIGRRQYLEDLAVYKNCLEKDDWPGYSKQIVELTAPAWL